MPLTSKGQEIKSHLEKEYGKEHGDRVLYAGKNKGTFTGIDSRDDAMNFRWQVRFSDGYSVSISAPTEARARDLAEQIVNQQNDMSKTPRITNVSRQDALDGRGSAAELKAVVDQLGTAVNDLTTRFDAYCFRADAGPGIHYVTWKNAEGKATRVRVAAENEDKAIQQSKKQLRGEGWKVEKVERP